MRVRAIGLSLVLLLSASACPVEQSDTPPPSEASKPFEDPVERASVPAAPEYGEPAPLRLAVRTTALDLDTHGWKAEVTSRQASKPSLSGVIEQFERDGGFEHEHRGISRAVTHDAYAELQTVLGDLAIRYREFANAIDSDQTTPILALDLEGKVRMEIVHRVIRTANRAGIDEFVAIVQTSSGPGRITWAYADPKPGEGLLASPNFGLSAMFTSDGAYMTLGTAESGVPASLANPSGACPTAAAENGVLDPELVLARIRELPIGVRHTLAFRFADDLTWSQAAPILAAIQASGILLEISPAQMPGTDCDEPFLAADYRPPIPEADYELDELRANAKLESLVTMSEPRLEGDGLPAYMVRRMIEARIGELGACRRAAIAADPATAIGTFAVAASIDAKGKLTDFTSTTTQLTKKTMACVNEAAARWTFPKPSDGAPVSFEVDVRFE